MSAVIVLGTRPHECPKRPKSAYIPAHSARVVDSTQHMNPLHTSRFQPLTPNPPQRLTSTGSLVRAQYRPLVMADSALAAVDRGLPPAIEQALALCEATPAPGEAPLVDGYLDLLGPEDPTGSLPAQRLMVSRALPQIYQRFWRPLGARLLMGLGGPDTAEEHRIALKSLSIAPGDRVLDVACGPGNFTRDFADAASDGLVVGIDASATMLATAVRETAAANVAYLRGDASALPFGDGCFDAVCCFAALYLIKEPMRAVAEIVRVLAPGGRLALLTSCGRGLLPAGPVNALSRPFTGVRIFARDELTRALAGEGLVGVDQRVTGLAQFVSARKPGVS
jgi:SAM-dependent methyltransferase